MRAEKHEGLVRVYLNSAHETLVLRDENGSELWSAGPDEVRAAYGPIYAVGEEDLSLWYGLDCPMPYVYEADVLFVPPPLSKGKYTLEWTSALASPVNDGTHACEGIGWEGFPAPSLYRGETVVVSTIIVK